MADKLNIKPADGKLGVLTPGMGAVSSTFVAGVCAIRSGLRLPIGSFTQMGHIRLGKRTDDRQPLVKNFVPLTELDNIVFGGWDIFEDSVYDAAINAGVLEKELLDQIKPELEQIKPMKAVFDQYYVKKLEGTTTKKTPTERTEILKSQSILTHLQLIAERLGGLADPIEKKIKDGVLFSEKAVSQTNQLFDRQAGILRSVLDSLETDNAVLKQYVLDEGQKMVQNCIDFATEHEERLVEGLCLPQAAPLFLSILDCMSSAARHEVDIAQILFRKS